MLSAENLHSIQNCLEAEMQDVTGDSSDVNHAEAHCVVGFFNSPVTEPRKKRKQDQPRSQKSMFCMP